MNRNGTIILEHHSKHPPAAIWRVLTTPELHAKWWGAGDIRAEVGHRFELDMGSWGKQPCEVIAVEAERLLRYRFATQSLDTTITFTLVAEGNGTRLIFKQEGFDLDSPIGKAAYEGMKPGWPALLARLEDIAG